MSLVLDSLASTNPVSYEETVLYSKGMAVNVLGDNLATGT